MDHFVMELTARPLVLRPNLCVFRKGDGRMTYPRVVVPVLYESAFAFDVHLIVGERGVRGGSSPQIAIADSAKQVACWLQS